MAKAKKFLLILITSLFIFLLCSCGGKKQNRTVVLEINYPKIDVSALYDDNVIVYVDKVEVGKVKFGQGVLFTMELTDGSHKIYVKNDALVRKYKSNKMRFTVGEKQDYFQFEVKAGNWKKIKKTGTSSIKKEAGLEPQELNEGLEAVSEKANTNTNTNTDTNANTEKIIYLKCAPERLSGAAFENCFEEGMTYYSDFTDYIVLANVFYNTEEEIPSQLDVQFTKFYKETHDIEYRTVNFKKWEYEPLTYYCHEYSHLAGDGLIKIATANKFYFQQVEYNPRDNLRTFEGTYWLMTSKHIEALNEIKDEKPGKEEEETQKIEDSAFRRDIVYGLFKHDNKEGAYKDLDGYTEGKVTYDEVRNVNVLELISYDGNGEEIVSFCGEFVPEASGFIAHSQDYDADIEIWFYNDKKQLNVYIQYCEDEELYDKLLIMANRYECLEQYYVSNEDED